MTGFANSLSPGPTSTRLDALERVYVSRDSLTWFKRVAEVAFHYTARGTFAGATTLFVSRGDPRQCRKWQVHCSQPIRVQQYDFGAEYRPGREDLNAHMVFDRQHVPLFAHDLNILLGAD